MGGSIYGNMFRVATWGESHGRAIGVVVDGCPAGIPLTEEDIQAFLRLRKPGQSRYTTGRTEADQVEILSGVFEGKTTGTPISMMVQNRDQRSRDYHQIAECYRPGHADYGFDRKYGFRDYRGGGRSSGRETIARVAAGAVASKILQELGIKILAYTKSIGPIEISGFDEAEIEQNPLRMPDTKAAKKAEKYLDECLLSRDSSGGVIECVIKGMKPGIGEPVFDKLDARLAQAVLSIGAVKGIEIGDGFAAAGSTGTVNNDSFRYDQAKGIYKESNHAGGILGGMSDGSDIVFRAAFKPTPSIAQNQKTINRSHENVEIEIHGRHDPVVVPRAVIVVKSMAAIVLADAIFCGMAARIDLIRKFWKQI
jgi:chorismate synthase